MRGHVEGVYYLLPSPVVEFTPQLRGTSTLSSPVVNQTPQSNTGAHENLSHLKTEMSRCPGEKIKEELYSMKDTILQMHLGTHRKSNISVVVKGRKDFCR